MRVLRLLSFIICFAKKNGGKTPAVNLFIHKIKETVPVITAEIMGAFTGAESYPAFVKIFRLEKIRIFINESFFAV